MLPLCTIPTCPNALHPAQKLRVLAPFLALVLGFAGLEWVIGRLSHSLALQSDSGHMLADAIAILIALGATGMTRLTRRYRRFLSPRWDLGAAIINAIGLVLMLGLIAWEACKHLYHPPPTVISFPMLLTAIVGLGVNGIGLWRLHVGSQQDLNLRGVFLHSLADLASSIGVIVAAIAISLLGWVWLDGLMSLGIAGLIGSSGLWLIRQSWAQWHQPALSPSLSASGWQEIGTTDLLTVIQR
ncbi:cation diffusion facilitator family transporter [Trichothermofontia sp.]